MDEVLKEELVTFNFWLPGHHWCPILTATQRNSLHKENQGKISDSQRLHGQVNLAGSGEREGTGWPAGVAWRGPRPVGACVPGALQWLWALDGGSTGRPRHTLHAPHTLEPSVGPTGPLPTKGPHDLALRLNLLLYQIQHSPLKKTQSDSASLIYCCTTRVLLLLLGDYILLPSTWLIGGSH